MIILYLHQYFNTPEMTGGTRSFEMARRFVKMGHEVHMVTSYREQTDKNDWFITNEEGIIVHWLPILYSNEMSYSQRIKAFFDFALKSSVKASKIKADIVYATSTPLTIALPAIYSSKKQKIPMVFEVRDLWPELPIAMGALKNPITKYLAKKLEKIAYKNSKAIVALSPGMKEGVVSTGISRKRVAVIPNSSDIELFKENNEAIKDFKAKRKWIDENTSLIIYAGTFGLINGVSYMVNLAKELWEIDKNIKILLVGKGKEFNKVTNLAKKEEVLNKNLFIESNIPKKNVPHALNAADMTTSLFIDKKEMQANSANKFFDALAAKKPIMINYGGWQKDLIDTYKCGLVLWKLSYKDAAEKIVRFLNEGSTVKQASEASSFLAKSYFDRDVLAKQLEQVISEVKNENYDAVEEIAPGDYEKIENNA